MRIGSPVLLSWIVLGLVPGFPPCITRQWDMNHDHDITSNIEADTSPLVFRHDPRSVDAVLARALEQRGGVSTLDPVLVQDRREAEVACATDVAKTRHAETPLQVDPVERHASTRTASSMPASSGHLRSVRPSRPTKKTLPKTARQASSWVVRPRNRLLWIMGGVSTSKLLAASHRMISG